jgi:nitroreductase
LRQARILLSPKVAVNNTFVSPEQLVSQLQWRYAVKKFDSSRKIPAEQWAALEAALVLTPSSYGLQPWKFWVITDPGVKSQLPSMSWGQNQPAECSHVVVFAIRKGMGVADIDRHLNRIVEVRGGSVEALGGFRKMMTGHLTLPAPQFNVDHWATNQCYIALGNFMTAAALMGIDTCPMEGIEPEKYNTLLKLPEAGYSASVVCVAGYRAEDDKYARIPKVRYKTEDVIVRV